MWLRAAESGSILALLRRNSKLPIKLSTRSFHIDGRERLSAIWAPNSKERNIDFGKDGAHGMLLKAGFLSQAHSGIFHLLPFGLRVQEKVEKLIDKHMRSVGASKLSLSSVSSESLWRKSGRLENAELLRVTSRRSNESATGLDGLLLCPTHEEEITALIARAVHSPKALPVRLYQISRKYRDELRPRGGLLRTREFTMKDLYTFDIDDASAMQTYKSVVEAYRNLFNDLRIPYLVAEADSGAMGGSHSHEFHFISSSGEDTLFTCNVEGELGCGYTVNSELLEREDADPKNLTERTDMGVNGHTDSRHECPRCKKGQLVTHRAIELGHTFHLGTRYTTPLGAVVARPEEGRIKEESLSMGCHGIGVSRMIAAVAAVMADSTGLNWPRILAPWEVVIVPGSKAKSGDCERIYDILMQHSSQQGHQQKRSTSPLIDTIIDDRQSSMISKLKDADLVGYPVTAVLGSAWYEHGKVEVQCKQKGIKVDVSLDDLTSKISDILGTL